MTLRKLNTGNYFGYYRGYSVFLFKRPHGGWCVMVRKGGKAVFGEGYFGLFLPILKKARDWAKKKIDSISTEKK